MTQPVAFHDDSPKCVRIDDPSRLASFEAYCQQSGAGLSAVIRCRFHPLDRAGRRSLCRTRKKAPTEPMRAIALVTRKSVFIPPTKAKWAAPGSGRSAPPDRTGCGRIACSVWPAVTAAEIWVAGGAALVPASCSAGRFPDRLWKIAPGRQCRGNADPTRRSVDAGSHSRPSLLDDADRGRGRGGLTKTAADAPADETEDQRGPARFTSIP